MQLEDFVAESLRQVVAGVKRAQETTGGLGGIVNPQSKGYAPGINRIDFDVAVTAVEEAGTKGGIGILGGVVGLGAQGESNASNTTASRIKFSVAVALPAIESDRHP